MNKEQLTAYSDRLRNIADFIDTLPEIEDIYFGDVGIACSVGTKENITKIARHLGSFRKEIGDSFFGVVKEFGDSYINFFVSRDRVCQRIEKKVVRPAREETVLPALPEREETVVEWECPDSLLAPQEVLS